jgi:hypothetical protein
VAKAWVVMPVVNGREMTGQAIEDCLAQQGVDVQVLVVLQGDVDFREELEQMAQMQPRLLVWSHNPQLPSLSATWNRALRFCWEAGAEHCLVVNNDIRLDPRTYQGLWATLAVRSALFVSAVGVRQPQFDAPARAEAFRRFIDGETGVADLGTGGPDFSCFLISNACHAKYPFDEGFIPAYREDCSYHRELMLAGDGNRIFSVNLPYLHYASQTVQAFTPEQRASWAQRSEISRQHYIRKWGGNVNEERFTVAFDPTSAREGVTNPDLQRRVQSGRSAPDEVLCDAPCTATPDSAAPYSADFRLGGDTRSALDAEAAQRNPSWDRA